jgi:hypothetical protein
MGMDLVGKNGDYHLNWTGWRILVELLEQLDCDISELSGSNDGLPIKSKSCKAFAKAIKQALKDNIIVPKFVENKMYAGGGYESFAVVKKIIKKTKQLKKDLNIAAIKEEDRDWLKEIYEFFENCGGCKQW